MHLQLPMKHLLHVQQEDHNKATRCYLCQKQFNENEETAQKHADHCHITGDYRGPTCQYCNLNNLSLKGMELPIFFHNLKGMELPIFFHNLGGYDMHNIIIEV